MYSRQARKKRARAAAAAAAAGSRRSRQQRQRVTRSQLEQVTRCQCWSTGRHCRPSSNGQPTADRQSPSFLPSFLRRQLAGQLIVNWHHRQLASPSTAWHHQASPSMVSRSPSSPSTGHRSTGITVNGGVIKINRPTDRPSTGTGQCTGTRP